MSSISNPSSTSTTTTTSNYMYSPVEQPARTTSNIRTSSSNPSLSQQVVNAVLDPNTATGQAVNQSLNSVFNVVLGLLKWKKRAETRLSANDPPKKLPTFKTLDEEKSYIRKEIYMLNQKKALTHEQEDFKENLMLRLKQIVKLEQENARSALIDQMQTGSPRHRSKSLSTYHESLTSGTSHKKPASLPTEYDEPDSATASSARSSKHARVHFEQDDSTAKQSMSYPASKSQTPTQSEQDLLGLESHDFKQQPQMVENKSNFF